MKRFCSLALVLVVGSSLMLSCGTGSDDESAAGAAPDGEWVLESLVIDSEAIVLPDGPVDFQVRVSAAGGAEVGGSEIGGSAGCNSLGGSALFNDDGSAQITDLFWTDMACAEPSLMEFEVSYTQAISGVATWMIDGDQLVLQGPDAQMTYVPRVAPPALPIVGTVWTLDTFFDGDSATNQSGMDLVTVTFSDGGVSASGDCWSIGGFATVEPGGQGNLSVDFTTADPDFSCEDRGFFSEMMSRLSGVSDYSIDENRLTLGDGSGPVIGFRSRG